MTNKFSIFAQLINDEQRSIPAGIERDFDGSTRLRVAEKDVSSITELAYFLPIRLINSQSHHLFESGPSFRRKYLDWGLFYHFERFLPCWRHFERALKQRNAVLKGNRPQNELDVWTNELILYGSELDELRRAYIKALIPELITLVQELLGLTNLDITYQPGWDEEINYAQVFSRGHHPHNEYRLGYTQYGPHRADFDIKIDSISARHFLSRGQQKLLICAMILAQGMLLAKHANKELVYLVDDLPSELDLQSRAKLVSLLSRQQTQVFITAIEREIVCNLLINKSEVPVQVFHVEHGQVQTQA